MKIGFSRNLTAFSASTIGTKVLNHENFLDAATLAIEQHNPSKDRAPGQHFIMCPEAVPYVSAGVGRRTLNPKDYLARCHRGRVDVFLKREHAATAEGCALIVYTREAYINDPDVQKEPDEIARIQQSDFTHILIAVLAFAGPKAPLSPLRFVANLAGGNNEVKGWSREEILAKAEEVLAYDNDWCVVSDGSSPLSPQTSQRHGAPHYKEQGVESRVKSDSMSKTLQQVGWIDSILQPPH
ncbi:hypothetical protein IT412_01545 [Candidatus Peregrinibacteria bacterium]|nr:hypothetical protein [Candidatus Peregrinibacteria bacterium]